MKDKKSFVLFTDIIKPIETMTDEDAGKLFKAILEYQNGGIERELAGTAGMAFVFVKQQIDRSNEHYEMICERNRVNGAKGGRPITQHNPKNPVGYLGTQPNPTEPNITLLDPHPHPHPDPEPENDKDKKEKKHRYGEFKHVLLTDKEFDKLKGKVNNREEWIKILDEGLELKDYGYKSHYMAILKWYRKENKSKVPPDELANKNYAEGW